MREALVVMPQVDGCSKLAAQQYLGAGPFYLYLGTACSAGDCPGEALSASAKGPCTHPSHRASEPGGTAAWTHSPALALLKPAYWAITHVGGLLPL